VPGEPFIPIGDCSIGYVELVVRLAVGFDSEVVCEVRRERRSSGFEATALGVRGPLSGLHWEGK
jgi:hypothetical protein